MKRLIAIALLLAACTAPYTGTDQSASPDASTAPSAEPSPTGDVGEPIETVNPSPDEGASSTAGTCGIPEGCGGQTLPPPTLPPTDQ